jgi:protein-tyrosine phosphatase
VLGAVIDLHCHLLPGIDDGSPDDETSLTMAKIAIDDGIRCIACTPHVYPGLYENTAADIRERVARLQAKLDAKGLKLRLTTGADAHLTPELLSRLRAATVPTLGGSRYFLLEPPHHVYPPRFEDSVFQFVLAGYIPVITHPERLTWISDHYDVFEQMARRGVWMQVTAGSLTGRFGRGAKYWGERMLGDGLVHLLATDAHTTIRRAPLLAEGRIAAEKIVGPREAERLVLDRPHAILDDVAPANVEPTPALEDPEQRRPRESKRGIWSRLSAGR